MSFAAYRNASSHIPTPTSPGKDYGPSKTKRKLSKAHKNKRISQACSNCRERRVKCDRIQPCSACCSKGIYENCVYMCHPQDHEPIRQSIELQRLRLENERLKARLQVNKPLDVASSVETNAEFPDSENAVSAPALLPPTTKAMVTPEQQHSSIHKTSSQDRPSDAQPSKSTKPLTSREKSGVVRKGAGSQPRQHLSKTSKRAGVSNPAKSKSLELGSSKNPQSNEKGPRPRINQLSPFQKVQATDLTTEPTMKLSMSTQTALNCIARSGSSVKIIKAGSPQDTTDPGTQKLPGTWTATGHDKDFEAKPEPNVTSTTSLKSPHWTNTANNNFAELSACYNNGALYRNHSSFRDNDSFNNFGYAPPLFSNSRTVSSFQYPPTYCDIPIGYMMAPSLDSSSTMTEPDSYGYPYSNISTPYSLDEYGSPPYVYHNPSLQAMLGFNVNNNGQPGSASFRN